MRGENKQLFKKLVFNPRYTPTCVGKTNYAVSWLRIYRGTPPRAWGKRPDVVAAVRTGKVHPHVRGENDMPEITFRQEYRYTPTCVGKTKPVGLNQHELSGTPPRAWGKRAESEFKRRTRRYTPTCVGKTRVLALEFLIIQVHPHVRGENGLAGRQASNGGGTPPHAWGKLIISRLPCYRHTVHPHMRGENNPHPDSPTSCIGTPPHAWGKRSLGTGHANNIRYTPTCVGKTESW